MPSADLLRRLEQCSIHAEFIDGCVRSLGEAAEPVLEIVCRLRHIGYTPAWIGETLHFGGPLLLFLIHEAAQQGMPKLYDSVNASIACRAVADFLRRALS